MLRQVPSRNQRSKGFKVKHALQICLLVAICIWLLYQVKHSHQKKRAFEERKSKILNNVDESQADFFNFGRKDLHHNKEIGSVNETGKEDETEDAEGGGHDTRQQEETKDEEEKGTDEIDDQDHEKGGVEAEHGEESIEEVGKDGQDDEKNSHDHDEEKGGHDEIDLFDSQEHEGSTQEAREENYKRDDASSAVFHDTHTTESENGNEDAQNVDEEQVIDKVDYDLDSNNGSKHKENSSVNSSEGVDDSSVDGSKGEVGEENSTTKIVESENVADGGSRGDGDSSVGFVSNDTVVKDNKTVQTDNLSSNKTASDNMDVGVELAKAGNGSVSNSTTIEYNSQMDHQTNLTTAAESNGMVEPQSNSTTYTFYNQTAIQNSSTMVDADGIPALNDTANLDSAQSQKISAENATKGEGLLESHNMMNISSNNATVGADTLKSQNVVDISANIAAGVEDAINSPNVVDISSNDATMGEDGFKSQNVVEPAEEPKIITGSESEENSSITSTNVSGESDNLSSHSVITDEERDARTDLSTLPDIQNEVKTTDEEAAE